MLVAGKNARVMKGIKTTGIGMQLVQSRNTFFEKDIRLPEIVRRLNHQEHKLNDQEHKLKTFELMLKQQNNLLEEQNSILRRNNELMEEELELKKKIYYLELLQINKIVDYSVTYEWSKETTNEFLEKKMIESQRLVKRLNELLSKE